MIGEDAAEGRPYRRILHYDNLLELIQV
jgi:hypothetical protein